ncbi:J domain-containing protein [Microbacterium sp. SORGH_AS_0888]|uniref:J domain-containing protein n=1 Tax=Microbacterium sp. SORGH_AS_0888 TaxID=3041791 RepID=UPI00278A5511|nr:J domain-containing protein [Microbacterium sp. SORGH_AS_0888]MDQ1129535.1 curved DNA-binding protein CbpA [Microbacterium sp. SORGH_AS_0888]
MFDSPLSASAYEVLGVDATATEDELRRAFRQRLRDTHPDTGGDAAAFVRVQRAWELVGTAHARAVYDRGHGFAAAGPDAGGWRPASARPDTRPRARSAGQPGGWRRERYLTLVREWAGRGVALEDPYDPALLRSAPRHLRRLLADALAEEATARIVADLGMGYTVWHDVAASRDGDPEAKLDHIVLGPSGLYGLLSEDFGGPVGFRRGEITGPQVPDAPVTRLLSGVRHVARAARVRFGGAIVVLPDDDVPQQITELGSIRGVPVAVVGRSALSTVLRRGVRGARDIGGNEVFDIRTRLDQTVRFV